MTKVQFVIAIAIAHTDTEAQAIEAVKQELGEISEAMKSDIRQAVRLNNLQADVACGRKSAEDYGSVEELAEQFNNLLEGIE